MELRRSSCVSCPSRAAHLCFLIFFCLGRFAEANIAEANIAFASHFHGDSVLQRDVAVAVFGNSTGVTTTRVVVTLDGVSVGEAAVAPDGSWRTYLPPQPASWGRELAVADGAAPQVVQARLTVKFGEVVMCSGQSNMQMPVNHYRDCGQHCFSAANGTAEAAAAGRYTGKISLMSLQTPFPRPTAPAWNGTSCGMPNAPSYKKGCVPYPQWQAVSPGPNGTLHGFSAVCWYTGKALFEQQLKSAVPVGLIAASVGGSAIELWLPRGRVNGSAASGACGPDDPPCDNKNNLTDSLFFDAHVAPLRPYTLGLMVWDQGERDVHCFSPATTHTPRYPCLQRALVESWRSARDGFNSSFAFVAVQLPGYLGDCDQNGLVPLVPNCLPGVYNMRLAQDELQSVVGGAAEAAPTYDLGCPFGVKTDLCPFGSVHNVVKAPVGARVARQLWRLATESKAGKGPGSRASARMYPRAVAAAAAASSSVSAALQNYTVVVRFAGGKGPLALAPTQNCAACCHGEGDFDVSADGGLSYANASALPLVRADGQSVEVRVLLPGQPTHVRYTANQAFPQCAVVDAQRLPAYPFKLAVSVTSNG
eukprot:g3160.t1